MGWMVVAVCARPQPARGRSMKRCRPSFTAGRAALPREWPLPTMAARAHLGPEPERHPGRSPGRRRRRRLRPRRGVRGAATSARQTEHPPPQHRSNYRPAPSACSRCSGRWRGRKAPSGAPHRRRAFSRKPAATSSRRSRPTAPGRAAKATARAAARAGPATEPVGGYPDCRVGDRGFGRRGWRTEIAAEAAPGMALAADGAAARFGPAAGAAWRAALASTAFIEALGHDATAAGTPSAPASVRHGGPGLRTPGPARSRAARRGALPPPALDPTTAESVHSQIVKSIRLQWSGGLGEARVTLKPGYLGEVVASIKVEHGVVTATLQSDTPEVRRWMESHTATLRDALVEHGLEARPTDRRRARAPGGAGRSPGQAAPAPTGPAPPARAAPHGRHRHPLRHDHRVRGPP